MFATVFQCAGVPVNLYESLCINASSVRLFCILNVILKVLFLKTNDDG